MIKRLVLVYFVSSFVLFSGCSEADVAVPKPRIYPKVEYPERGYQSFNSDDCDFTFQYPVYSDIIYKSDDNAPLNACFFDMFFPMYHAAIYCSAFEIKTESQFEELVSDSYEIVAQINKRSEYMEEFQLETPTGFGGILFQFSGPAASPLQFYLSDTSDLFFKGALYFNTETNADSLQPIVTFLKEDVLKLVETLERRQ
jgi:gliding motility-associated lipoprotein GldD